MEDKGLQTAFESFAKEGKLSPESVKKWFKDAAIIGKETGIAESDVDAAVTKVSKDPKGLDLAGLKECVNALAKEKKAEPKELLKKLATAGAKGGKPAVADPGAKVIPGGKQN